MAGRFSSCVAMMVASAGLLTASCQEAGRGPMDDEREDAHAMTNDEVVQIATVRARELGYETESMSATVECERHRCIVKFLPIQKQFGGDLYVTVDATSGAIVRIQRGQ